MHITYICISVHACIHDRKPAPPYPRGTPPSRPPCGLGGWLGDQNQCLSVCFLQVVKLVLLPEKRFSPTIPCIQSQNHWFS